MARHLTSAIMRHPRVMMHIESVNSSVYTRLERLPAGDATDVGCFYLNTVVAMGARVFILQKIS